MSLPMLQVALDNQTLSHAYETTRLIAEEVDIIEVGTILCVGEGVRAVRDLKALYPHKIVLADAKIADAGKFFPVCVLKPMPTGSPLFAVRISTRLKVRWMWQKSSTVMCRLS